MMNLNAVKEYFSADEAKIAFGVWAGGFVTDFISATIYNAIFKPKESTQAEEQGGKLKALVIDILIKGLVGVGLYSFGKENLFLRYMAIGSMVSIINSIANYFLPKPASIAQKASAFVSNAGYVIQTV